MRLTRDGCLALDAVDPLAGKRADFALADIDADLVVEAAYLANPGAGNCTLSMGSQMPMATPVPLDQGGTLGIGGMAGLGLYSFDLTDPAKPAIAGCFVPRYPTAAEMPDWTCDNAGFAVFTECDRNII